MVQMGGFNYRQALLRCLIIMSIIALGLIITDKYIDVYYKEQLLVNPCAVCVEKTNYTCNEKIIKNNYDFLMDPINLTIYP